MEIFKILKGANFEEIAEAVWKKYEISVGVENYKDVRLGVCSGDENRAFAMIFNKQAQAKIWEIEEIFQEYLGKIEFVVDDNNSAIVYIEVAE